MTSSTATCRLCGSSEVRLEAPAVRDNADLQVLACARCGLIFLSSFDHADEAFYAQSGMYDGAFDLVASRRETAADDARRVARLIPLLRGRRVLDLGCGNGGFLLAARDIAASVAGVDPHRALDPHFERDGLTLHHQLADVDGAYDVITLFHVLEHVPDPRGLLRSLHRVAAPGADVIVEVPNGDDALLRLYRSEAFARFTYWSCHLYTFTAATLRRVAEESGATVAAIEHVQRYPLSNHLHWLACGQPRGHQVWGMLDAPELTAAYERQLASLGMTDTLSARLSFSGTER